MHLFLLQNTFIYRKNMNTSMDSEVPEMPTQAQALQQDSRQSISDKMNEDIKFFTCTVCFDIMEDVKITKCGHSYCNDCILKSIELCHMCPNCSGYLAPDDIFPNFQVSELIKKHKERIETMKSFARISRNPQDLIIPNSNESNEHGIDNMIDKLSQRKDLLEKQEAAVNHKVMCEFLLRHMNGRDEVKKDLEKVCNTVKRDLNFVVDTLKTLSVDCPENKNSLPNAIYHVNDPIFSEQRRRVNTHYESLVNSYNEIRFPQPSAEDQTPTDSGLRNFYFDVGKFSRYKSMRQLALINHSHESPNSMNIVSSIEFNKDNEIFAVAGVMKKIKIYNYQAIVNSPYRDHPAIAEMMSTSKISCLSWNSFQKNYLASSDYEGSVMLWDAETKQEVKTYREHERRCWSVNFNSVDTKILASASDDTTVKLWSIDAGHSFATIEAHTNVCCVQFNPHSSCHLAFGASDHGVHYYDVRNLKKALMEHSGHRKAVSYVKFLNEHEIVSASTDAELRLWNVNERFSVRTFRGHCNDKNFIGLATDGEYIACGSENNSLYFYYKMMITPVFKYGFEMDLDGITDDQLDVPEDKRGGFVSAVCWRPHSKNWIAANSQGLMKVLELV